MTVQVDEVLTGEGVGDRVSRELSGVLGAWSDVEIGSGT
jgi:hypothetical protein